MNLKRILLYNIFHTKRDLENFAFGKPVYIRIDGIWSIARGWSFGDGELKYKLNDERGLILDSECGSTWEPIPPNDELPQQVVIQRNLKNLRRMYPPQKNKIPSLGTDPSSWMDLLPRRSREFREYIGEVVVNDSDFE
jgi:hypothetical protein